MSVIRVNNITNRSGNAGPMIAGVGIVSSTSYMVVPTGRTGQRYADNGENIVRDGLVLYLDAKYSYPSTTGIGTTTQGAAATAGSSLEGEPYTWYDMSGYENHGEVIGAGYNSTNGGTLVFDGVNDYIDCGTSNNIKIDGGNFTILIVFYIRSISPNQFGTFFYQSGDGNGDSLGKSIMLQRTSNDTITLEFYSIPTTTATFTSGFAPNTMVFLAVKFNRTTRATKFFRNGVFSSEIISDVAPNFSTLTSTQIGRRYRSSAGFSASDLLGDCYLTMVYNRDLTDSEILQNYNTLRSRFGI